ncbi:MAG: hypothetical protein LC109_00210 [Bacteroidia bacterium]|nr:hypothetical protein [Bacteroidia bacterium]
MKKIITKSLLLATVALISTYLGAQSPSWTTSGNDAFCTTNGATRFVVKEDGTVWVGNGSGTQFIDSAIFFVDGHMRVREIVVDMASWPDYVFGNNYILLPLDSVAAFIEKNGHLPSVPPADSVAKNGLNLAETNAILLRKIEELQLYILQLNKRLNALEEQKDDACLNRKIGNIGNQDGGTNVEP